MVVSTPAIQLMFILPAFFNVTVRALLLLKDAAAVLTETVLTGFNDANVKFAINVAMVSVIIVSIVLWVRVKTPK